MKLVGLLVLSEVGDEERSSERSNDINFVRASEDVSRIGGDQSSSASA